MILRPNLKLLAFLKEAKVAHDKLPAYQKGTLLDSFKSTNEKPRPYGKLHGKIDDECWY